MRVKAVLATRREQLLRSGRALPKQFVPPLPLRVTPVADLRPRGSFPVAPKRPLRHITAMLVLGDDAFEIEPAAGIEQRRSALLDVIGIDDGTGLRRNEFFQQTFARNEWLIAKIPAVEPQKIKGAETVRTAPAKQIIEVRPAVQTEADDLSIEHGVTAGEGFGDGGTQARIDFEGMAVSRYEPQVPAMFSVGDSPEAVVFQFEDEVGMIKGAWHACKPHGRESAVVHQPESSFGRGLPPSTQTSLFSGAHATGLFAHQRSGFERERRGLWEVDPDLLSAQQECRLKKAESARRRVPRL